MKLSQLFNLRRLAVSICLVIGVTLMGFYPSTSIAAAVAEGIQIPVIINLYPKSGATEDEAKEAVKEANKILKQAGFKMVVVKVNKEDDIKNHPDTPGGGDNGDGRFSNNERGKIRTFGGNELSELSNKKGIKISFGEVPKIGSTTPGLSVHRDPTIIVKDRGDARLSGETIAHEFGHVMTLCGRFKIKDLNGDKDYDDAGERANRNGHASQADGEHGKKNFMAPSNWREGPGIKITKEQKEEMWKERFKRGKCAVQFETHYPAVKRKQQFGTVTDERGDQIAAPTLATALIPAGYSRYRHPWEAARIYDLHQVYLSSLSGDADIEAQVTVSGVLPVFRRINAVYELGFDIDNNESTGAAYAGLKGVDRIVSVRVRGMRWSRWFSITGTIEDTVSGFISALPVRPTYQTEEEYLDLHSGKWPVPKATSFLFNIPKDRLGLPIYNSGEPVEVPPLIPVVATAGNKERIFDSAAFYYDPGQWFIDPTVTTFGTGIPTAGEDYPIAVTGLTPNTDFNFKLNDTIVLSGILDENGGFEGSFEFPPELPEDEMHFLTAQDATGEFGYSITCPDSGETAPDISVFPSDDCVQLDETISVVSVEICNLGDALLTIESIEIVAVDDTSDITQFSLSDPCTEISGINCCTVDVIFEPTVAGEANASLEIVSNDPNHSTTAVCVTAEALFDD